MNTYSHGLEASIVKASDGVVSRTINRRISTRISRRLASLPNPPSPDLVSVISAILVALGAPLFSMGLPQLGGVIAQIGSILDGVDGELARLTGRASKAGGLLDTILDRLADITLLLGVSLAAAKLLEPLVLIPLVMAALSGDLLVSYIHAVGEKTAGKHPALIGRIPNIAGRDTRIFIVFLAGILAKPRLALALIALVSYTYTITKTVELIKYVHEKEAGTHAP